MSAAGSTTPTPNKSTHDYSVTLNGIKWTALATKPTSTSDPTPIPTFDSTTNDGKITTETTQVTITGTVENTSETATGGFKYKYTNTSNGNLDGNNSQQLPSNITTIKITLKKK